MAQRALVGSGSPASLSTASVTYFGTWGSLNQSLPVLTTETQAQFAFRGAGATLKRLDLYVGTNGRGTSTAYAVRKAGADTALALTIGAGVTGLLSSVNDVGINAGDLWNSKIATGTGGGALSWNAAVELETAGQSYNPIGGNAQANTFATASATTYLWLAGRSDASLTEGNVVLTVPDAGTLSNIALNVTVNGRGTDSTVRARITGANGNQLVTVPAGAIGIFEDVSSTDALVAGDNIALSLTNGSGAGNLSWTATGAIFTSSTSNQSISICGTGFSVAASNTFFSPLWGVCNRTGATAHTDCRVSLPFPEVLKNLFAHVSANATSAASSVTLQVNGVDSGLVVTIGAGLTGVFSDITHLVPCVQGDLVSFKTVSGAGGAIRVDSIAVVHRANAIFGQPLQASNTPVASIGRVAAKGLLAQNSAVATLSTGLSYLRSLLASTTPIASLRRSASKALAAATTPAAALSTGLSYLRSLLASTTPLATLRKSPAKPLGAATTPAAALSRSTSKGVRTTTGPIAALARTTARALRATVTPAATLSQGISYVRSLLASTTPVAALRRSAAKVLRATTSPAASVRRSADKALAVQTTPAASLTKLLSRSLAAATTPIASLARAASITLQATTTPIAALTRALVRARAFVARITGAPGRGSIVGDPGRGQITGDP